MAFVFALGGGATDLGLGAFGPIVEAFDVRRQGSSPAQTTNIMDIYFLEFVETQPVQGFSIATS